MGMGDEKSPNPPRVGFSVLVRHAPASPPRTRHAPRNRAMRRTDYFNPFFAAHFLASGSPAATALRMRSSRSHGLTEAARFGISVISIAASYCASSLFPLPLIAFGIMNSWCPGTTYPVLCCGSTDMVTRSFGSSPPSPATASTTSMQASSFLIFLSFVVQICAGIFLTTPPPSAPVQRSLCILAIVPSKIVPSKSVCLILYHLSLNRLLAKHRGICRQVRRSVRFSLCGECGTGFAFGSRQSRFRRLSLFATLRLLKSHHLELRETRLFNLGRSRPVPCPMASNQPFS